MKTLAASLAIAGAMILAQPAAQAASSVDGLTVDLSAQTTVKKKVVVRNNGTTTRRTVVRTRTYAAPSYYGYYGPTYYERPYSRPATVTFGLGGWW